MKYRELTQEETEALQAFANAHGRNWKRKLSEVYWYNARVWRDENGDDLKGSILHSIRNEFGAVWLFDHCNIKGAGK